MHISRWSLEKVFRASSSLPCAGKWHKLLRPLKKKKRNMEILFSNLCNRFLKGVQEVIFNQVYLNEREACRLGMAEHLLSAHSEGTRQIWDHKPRALPSGSVYPALLQNHSMPNHESKCSRGGEKGEVECPGVEARKAYAESGNGRKESHVRILLNLKEWHGYSWWSQWHQRDISQNI